MLGDGDLERGELADPRLGNLRSDGAVDHANRQMPKQVHDARVRRNRAESYELVQKRLDARPHALERAHGGKERR